MLLPLPPPPMLPPLPGRHALACVDRQPTCQSLLADDRLFIGLPGLREGLQPRGFLTLQEAARLEGFRGVLSDPRKSENQIQLPACSAAGPRADSAARRRSWTSWHDRRLWRYRQAQRGRQASQKLVICAFDSSGLAW